MSLPQTQRQRPGQGGEVRVVRLVPGRLAEYEVSGAPFSVPLWLNLTAGIATLLFWLGLHLQDDSVLTALLVTLTLALVAKLHFKVGRLARQAAPTGDSGIQAPARSNKLLQVSATKDDFLVFHTKFPSTSMINNVHLKLSINGQFSDIR